MMLMSLQLYGRLYTTLDLAQASSRSIWLNGTAKLFSGEWGFTSLGLADIYQEGEREMWEGGVDLSRMEEYMADGYAWMVKDRVNDEDSDLQWDGVMKHGMRSPHFNGVDHTWNRSEWAVHRGAKRAEASESA